MIMATCTITSKGQVTIPVEIRKAMGLRIGDEIVFTKLPGTNGYELTRKSRSVKSIIGMFKSSQKAPTMEEIDDAIARQIVTENSLG